MPVSPQAAAGGGSIAGGLWGLYDNPYQDAMDEYSKYYDPAKGYQMPFYNAGVGAIGNYQDWSSKMSDPTQFINTIMNNYQESPYAKFQQQQGVRSAVNAGSASGLTGSSPMMQQIQQNSQNISSQDMNSWLQNVLGVNSQYGGSQLALMSGGSSSANALTRLLQGEGEDMGEAAAGKSGYEASSMGDIFGGAADLATL